MAPAPVILLVDDSEAMGVYLAGLLRARFAGYEVRVFPGVPEGLQGAARAGSALRAVITDFMMVGATGLDLLEALALPPGVAQIIVTSGGKLDPADAARAKALGARVLAKPTPETQEKWLMAVSLSVR